MVKIEGTSTYAASRMRKKAASKNTSDSFSVGNGADSVATTSDAADAHSTKELASLTHLMSLQEVDRQDPHHKKAIDEGDSILQSLEQLQNQILSGHISKSALNRIISMSGSLPSIVDPNLNTIIAEIRQRAMIEIAKIEMSTGEKIL